MSTGVNAKRRMRSPSGNTLASGRSPVTAERPFPDSITFVNTLLPFIRIRWHSTKPCLTPLHLYTLPCHKRPDGSNGSGERSSKCQRTRWNDRDTTSTVVRRLRLEMEEAVRLKRRCRLLRSMISTNNKGGMSAPGSTLGTATSTRQGRYLKTMEVDRVLPAGPCPEVISHTHTMIRLDRRPLPGQTHQGTACRNCRILTAQCHLAVEIYRFRHITPSRNRPRQLTAHLSRRCTRRLSRTLTHTVNGRLLPAMPPTLRRQRPSILLLLIILTPIRTTMRRQ